MENITKQLHAGNFSCVINSRGMIRTFTQRGVADLYDLLKTDADFLKGASVADKVVGKGAAALMVQGRVKEVYADLISEPAHALLVDAGVEVSYGQIVHHIENRDKNDWCPLEKSCKEEERVSDILPIIDNFIAKIRGKSFVLTVLFATICASVWAQESIQDTFSIPEVVMTGFYDRSYGHRVRTGFKQYGGYAKSGYEFSKNWNIFADVNITPYNASNPGMENRPIYDNDSKITRSMTYFSLENSYKRTSGALKFFYNRGRHNINDDYYEGKTPCDFLFNSKHQMLGFM